jgi:hypothetical protein
MISAQNAMRQAPMTANEYLREAIKSIDRHLGVGYAKKNPELLAAFIQGCTKDYSDAPISGQVTLGGSI